MADTTIWASGLEVELEIVGELYSASISSSLIEVEIEILGSVAVSQVISVQPIEVEVQILFSGISVASDLSNWVRWSEIGRAVFEINQSNIAGRRPLDWSGSIYDIKKLGGQLIAYGENGVSILMPVENTWGLKTIYRIGMINKGALAGDETTHYFIDKKYRLIQVNNEGISILDYSEYLSELTGASGIKLSQDPEIGIIYICDGTTGFIYSPQTQSFGKGPINVTGIGSKGGSLIVAAPTTTITIPKFEICTDIYDLETRKAKLVKSIELGTDLTSGLEVMVETRLSNKNNVDTVSNDNFKSTKWVQVNPDGKAYCPCFGVEFRFRVRSFIYEYFELDYIKIEGVIHGVSYMDTVQ